MSGVQTHTMHDIMIHRRIAIHKDQHMATAVWREEVPGVTVCDSHGAQLEVALAPEKQFSDFGFRCAMTIERTEE